MKHNYDYHKLTRGWEEYERKRVWDVRKNWDLKIQQWRKKKNPTKKRPNNLLMNNNKKNKSGVGRWEHGREVRGRMKVKGPLEISVASL